MQNSLERIFGGIAEGLREDVLPAVTDPYARAQVLASVELLGNVAERVEWRCADLHEEIGRIREVLAAAPAPTALLEEPLPHENAALVEARRRHLDALSALQRTSGGGERLRAFLLWQLGRELALLRTGMYKG